jgi:hypothetical protein
MFGTHPEKQVIEALDLLGPVRGRESSGAQPTRSV